MRRNATQIGLPPAVLFYLSIPLCLNPATLSLYTLLSIKAYKVPESMLKHLPLKPHVPARGQGRSTPGAPGPWGPSRLASSATTRAGAPTLKQCVSLCRAELRLLERVLLLFEFEKGLQFNPNCFLGGSDVLKIHFLKKGNESLQNNDRWTREGIMKTIRNILKNK